jgi:H+/Cl- antiporter ClcA
LAPAIFGGTVLTHLFGGSAGKEGAALQLGGSLAAWLSKILHLSEDDQHTLVSAGMGAFFSALFGTPLGAFIFVLEVLRQGRQCLKAAFPSLMASLIGFFTAGLCGMEWERFSFSVPALSWSIAWKGTVVAAIGGLIALVFCVCLHWGEDLAKKIVKNDYLRITFGGLLILGLTALVGSMEYNGGGMQVVERVFEGSVRYEAFALKMLFTILTVSAGFKGGEIVPSIFIGATLGGALAGALGLPIGFAAALGMIAVLGGVTNCPLAFSFVALEMFNGQGFGYMIVAAFLGYAFSFPVSLYSKIKKD